ncbi:MAG TPA: hypothetical protein DDW52_28540 [Planctomycetaceae bacterium]|nr:hypothetical protein [Planctomycetaceae bacterium]
MSKQTTSASQAVGEILNASSGFDLAELDWQATFLELGFDSLFLIQFSQKLKSKLGVKVSFRQLIEELPTLGALIAHVETLPGFEASQQPAPAEQRDEPAKQSDESDGKNSQPAATTDAPAHSPRAPEATTQSTTHEDGLQPRQVVANSAPDRLPPPSPLIPSPQGPPASGDLASLATIIAQQNELMRMQLEMLGGTRPSTPIVDSESEHTVALPPESSAKVNPGAAVPSSTIAQSAKQKRTKPEDGTGHRGQKRRERFGPYKPVRLSDTGKLTDKQQGSLDALIARFTAKTSGSRELAQQHREHFADPRGVAGYRRMWKSMVYQIAVERSKGSRLWDIDGNEYVDIAMGFGLNLFGQSPDFVTDAVKQQLSRGVEVGPQSPLAGEVAQLLCDFSRQQRATFCNTGSEAVMAAMRLARTVTGKNKIVFFNKDYHGNFDEVLLRCSPSPKGMRTTPAAPGVPTSLAESIMVLNYGDPASLETIRQQADDIAAVLVEPVQSADPFLQPREFLVQLRELTRDADIALIMDEVISGFRAAPGGAQEWFDVWADMATYGKVLGGGLPIGALTGSRRFMDALDGGMWRYEDESDPEADMTFFAGTFVRHPLAMVAAREVLLKVKEEGPELQQELTSRTEYLTNTLNQHFEENKFPIRVAQFTSLFRFMFPADLEYADLLYFHLLDRGIFTRGWADNCFLSTAHSDADVQRIIDAVIDSCTEIRQGGFMPHPEDVDSNAKPGKTVGVQSNPASKEQSISSNQSAGREPHSTGSTAKRDSSEDDDSADCPGQRFPLTETQQEILFTSRISDAASYANNEPFTVRLRGSLDEVQLKRAVNETLRRHPALHVRIDALNGIQEYVQPADFSIKQQDLTACQDQEAEIAKITDRLASTPFDLENEPLVRIELLKLSSEEHMLVFDGHHIVTDGWSWNVMLVEMGQIYSSLCTGEVVQLEPAGSFRQYVLGSPERDETAEEALQYWIKKFESLPEPLELPTDGPRATVQKYDAESVIRGFSAETYDAMKKVAAQAGCSLFTVGLTAYKILLSRLAGQADVVVGMRAAGQAIEDNPNLVGLCMNVLPMRTTLDPSQSAEETLRLVHRDLLEAFEYQDCTLGKIVRALPIKRVAGRMPLTDCHFNLDKDSTNIRFHGLEATVAMTPKKGINHDLFFNLNETPNGLVAYVDFRSDLYTSETIGRWLEHYEAIVSELAEDVTKPVGKLSLMTPEQRHQILVDWNATAAEYPALTAARLFEQRAESAPHAIAVSFKEKRLSYAELNVAANRLAHHLLSVGVKQDDYVGVLVERSERMLVATLALMKVGASYVPMEPDFPDDRLKMVASESRIAYLLTETALTGRQIAPDAISICMDEIEDALKSCSGKDLETAPELDGVAYVIFTSGSTGKPKGVCVTHRALTNFLCSMAKRPGFSKSDRIAGVTTLSFDIAGLELYLPLVTGGSLVIVDRIVSHNGSRLAKLLDDEQITVLQATPATFRLMLDAGWEGKADLKVLCGGEAFPPELASKLVGRCAEVWNMYGPTETTIWSTIKQIVAPNEPINIGRPIDNTTIYVLNDAARPVPVGAIGKLCIGGDGLAAGYLNQPELTAEKFVELSGLEPGARTRVYDTGDQARYLPSGEIQFLGRNDHQVKINGYRIELGEIESVISAHPLVDQAVVTLHHVDSQPRLVAFAKMLDSEVTVTSLRDFLKAKLPGYMVPSIIEFLREIPLTANGKVDRKNLPEPRLDRPELETQFAEPTTTMQAELVSIFKHVLGTERVGINDDFFELGGTSLAAARLMNALEEKQQRRLPLALLLSNPSVEKLAKILEDEGWEPSWKSLVPISPGGSKSPLYCVHAAGGNVLVYRDLARHLGDDRPIFGLQSEALAGDLPDEPDVQAIAERYTREIIAMQPTGVYNLCGYCLGGTIAYEIAVQLRKQGRAIGTVALFDTHRTWLEYSWAQEAYSGMQQIYFHAANLALSGPKGMQAFIKEKYAELRRRMSRKAAARRSKASADLKQQIHVLDTFYDRVTMEYSPAELDARVVVFKPRRAYTGYDRHTHGWEGLIENLKLVSLPVYPAGMMLEPFVTQLASELAGELDTVDGQSEELLQVV